MAILVAEYRAQRKLAAILAADVVGYSGLMGENEAETLSALRQLRNELFGPAINGHHGKLVKSMGDGWLVEFISAVDAVNCALQVQDRLLGHPIIKLRIGVHIGDVVHEDEDIFGDGVNIAARLQEAASPGGVVISEPTYGSLDGTLTPSFDDGGVREFKNIKRPVQIWVRGSSAEVVVGERGKVFRSHLAGFPRLDIRPIEISDDRAEVRELADALGFDLATYLNAPEWVDAKVMEAAESQDHTLFAALRTRGSRLRLEARLVSPFGEQVWSEKFDGDLEDSFDWQDTTAEAIAGAVLGTIIETEARRLSAKPENDLTAEECLLLAYVTIEDPDSQTFGSCLRLVRLAIERDPSLTIAYSWGAAFIGSAISLGFQSHIMEFLKEFEDWSKKIPTVSRTAGGLYSLINLAGPALNHDAAERRLGIEEQLRRAPFDAAALVGCGFGYLYLGEPELAMDCLKKARRFGDFGLPARGIRAGMAIAYVMTGKNAIAIEMAKETIARSPGYTAPYRAMAAAYANLGQTNDAERAIESLLALVPGETVSGTRERSGYLLNEFSERYLGGLRRAGLPE